MSAPAEPPATDRCPRCGGDFHCGARDEAPCPCTGFTLTPPVLEDLRRRYDGCLCMPCLAQLAAEQPTA